MIYTRLFVEQRLPTLGSSALESGWDFLSAGAGLLGSLIGASQSAQNTRRTNEMNLAIAAKNNASQERIAQQNNQTQIDMLRENNAWSANQADIAWNREREAFRQEAAYNSIGAQAQRALVAGLNPAALFGNGSSATASMSAPSAPSAAGSTISPLMPNFVTPTMMTPPSVMLGSVDAIAKLAGAASSLASAKKTGKEANRYDEWMDATLENLFSQAANADAQAAYTTLQTKIDALWLPRKYKQEIATSFMQGYSAMMQGKEAEASALLKKTEELLTNERYSILKQQGPALVQEVQENVKLVQEKQKTEQSEQSKNYAQRDLSIAQKKMQEALTDTENELRGLRKEQIENDIKSGRFGRVVSALETFFKAKGFNQPVWNILRNYSEQIGEWINKQFGRDKTEVQEFLEYLEKNTGESFFSDDSKDYIDKSGRVWQGLK